MTKISSKKILNFAYRIAQETTPDVVLIIVERKVAKKWFKNVPPELKVIFAFPDNELASFYSESKGKVIVSSFKGLSRFSKIRHILITAILRGYIIEKDQIICVTGSSKNREVFDSISVIDMKTQFRGIAVFREYSTKKNISLSVIESVLDIAIELGEFGREGETIGTIFIIGDTRKVLKLSKQMIFNPFKGYDDKEKNIKNPLLKESICELAKLDGAFIVRGDGTVCAAGRLLLMPQGKVSIVKGMGARHNAAAYITRKTNSVGIVVSESSGSVSIFIEGRILFELTSLVSVKKIIKRESHE